MCKSEIEAKAIASKMNENSAYPVYFFKTETSGEKLYEEFYTSDDIVNLEKFSSMGVITNSKKLTYSEIEIIISKISKLFNKHQYSKVDIINSINKLIPNFTHNETGKSLDEKM